MQCFASRQRPLLKFRAVLQKKLLQEFAAIKVNGLLQARRAHSARIQARMSVACGRDEVRVKTRNVERKIACRVELDFIASDVQVRRLRDGVAYRLAETKEGLAQIVTRGLLGVIGPKESDERIAAMRTVGFDGEINEERASFVRFKLGSRTIGQCDL